MADFGDASHDARFFFDKSKGSFRAGLATGTQWQRITLNRVDGFGLGVPGHATDDPDAENTTLANGELVLDKFEVKGLTIQILDDVDVLAGGSLSVDAGGSVILQTPGDFQVDHVKADGDVFLQAAGAITDLALDPEAALSTFGNLILGAGTSIEGADGTSALRIQLSPTSQLSVDVAGRLHIQQVEDDLSIAADFDAAVTGTTSQAISDLIVGSVKSGTMVDLTAQRSILDASEDSSRPVVDVFTGDVIDPVTGDVFLTAETGTIGEATNFLDVEIRDGDLTSFSHQSTFIHSVGDLNVALAESATVNVNLDVGGDAYIDLVRTLGELGDRDSVPILVDLLLSQDSPLEPLILESLGRIGGGRCQVEIEGVEPARPPPEEPRDG